MSDAFLTSEGGQASYLLKHYLLGLSLSCGPYHNDNDNDRDHRIIIGFPSRKIHPHPLTLNLFA